MNSHGLGQRRQLRTPDGRRLGYRVLTPAAPQPGLAGVVWVSGMGMSGVYWAALHRDMGTLTRSVIYDRAGIGDSDDDPEPRTLERLADDLRMLCDAVGGPVVLVGHSWGGPIARVAAAGLSSVRGVVLVDPSDEFLLDELTPRSSSRGRHRLWRTLRLYSIARFLPAETRRELWRVDASARASHAEQAEQSAFATELAWLRGHPPLSTIPTTLISGQRQTLLPPARRRRAAMMAAHARRHHADPAVRFVSARRSGHAVPLSEPGLVAAEVRRLLNHTP